MRRGGVIGRCEATTGIVAVRPAGRPRDGTGTLPLRPRASAGSSTTAAASAATPRSRACRAATRTSILVHLPTHASWLNQIELYFSIVQRKALTPNDCPDLAAVEQRLLDFETLYNDTAVPFRWRFTRADLADRLAALPDLPPPRATASPPPPATATLRAA